MVDNKTLDKQQKAENSAVFFRPETLLSVYLHSDESINFNLRQESKEEMEYLKKKAHSRAHLSELSPYELKTRPRLSQVNIQLQGWF